MSPPYGPADPGQSGVGHSHRLELSEMELVGGGREITFRPGLNIIQGDITTGKTTLVRLIRALLGTMPSAMPPEVDYIRALQGRVSIGHRTWQIYRPRTSTAGALVEIGEADPEPSREPIAPRRGNGPFLQHLPPRPARTSRDQRPAGTEPANRHHDTCDHD